MTGEYKPYQTFQGLQSSQALIVEYYTKDNNPEWLHLYYHRLKSRKVITIDQNRIIFDLETPEIITSLIIHNFQPDEYKQFISHLLRADIETIYHYPLDPQETEQPTITVNSVRTINDDR